MSFFIAELSSPRNVQDLLQTIDCRDTVTLNYGIVACEIGGRVPMHISESKRPMTEVISEVYGFVPAISLWYELPHDDAYEANIADMFRSLLQICIVWNATCVLLENGDQCVMHREASKVFELQSESDFWTVFSQVALECFRDIDFAFAPLRNI